MKKEYQYDYLIYIGRFQPIHLGHVAVIKRALELAEHVVILVGSANSHRSTRNPWTFDERSKMIKRTFEDSPIDPRIVCLPLNDHTYNDDAWVIEVKDLVNSVAKPGAKIALTGFDKDHTTYYLSMFPKWQTELIETKYSTTLNATSIRDMYFHDVPTISLFIPEEARGHLFEFSFTEEFKWLLKEYNYIREYKKSWTHAPFPPVFVTVDNIVTQSGHILLVTRGEAPYAGSLALPGGFINQKETLINSAVRELKEETRIADDKGELPPAMLKSFITKQEVFDDPERSDRGRSITHAFLYELPKRKELLKVRGDDDARHAAWYDIASLKAEDFMEDHFHIITKMLGITL